MRLVCGPMVAAGRRGRRDHRRPQPRRAAARPLRAPPAVDARQGGRARVGCAQRRDTGGDRAPVAAADRPRPRGARGRDPAAVRDLDGARRRRRPAAGGAGAGRSEIQAALGELREAIQRPLGRKSRATRTTFAAELKRLADTSPDLEHQLRGGRRRERSRGARAAGPEHPCRGDPQRAQARSAEPGRWCGPRVPTGRSCSRSSTTASPRPGAPAGDGAAAGGVRGAAERRHRRVRTARRATAGRCDWWCHTMAECLGHSRPPAARSGCACSWSTTMTSSTGASG